MIVDAIKNGIVIDHITAGHAMELYSILNLDELDCTVAILKNVPSKKKGKKDPFVKGISVGISGKNLYVWTKYTGYDPDVNVYGSIKKYGIDLGSYPPARTYMFDFKITF